MSSQLCPNCNKPLILRSGPYGKFYGCSNFPKCRYTKKYTADLESVSTNQPTNNSKVFIPSKYQLAIFETVKNTQKNILIQAVAGSGKSTTLIKIVDLLPINSKNIFLAFNRDIVKDLSTKIPSHCMIKTLHSLGYANVRKLYPNIRIDESKLDNLFQAYLDNHPVIKDDLANNKNAIIRNDNDGIVFSTIHKAKGLESDIVYLLNPELLPSKNAKTDWELTQEYNLKYVAYTRSKKELYLVSK